MVSIRPNGRRGCGNLPAEVTVDSGNFSRDPRKDIRNGTSEIWLIAFNALFEVSLVFN